MSEVERGFLRRLRDAAPAGLPRSQVPGGCAGLVETLRTCGAADWRPAGRGVALQILNRDAFSRLVAARYPLGIDVDLTAVTDRASAVALLGDAKAVRRGSCEGVFVRSTKPDAVVRWAGGEQTLPVGQLTQVVGGAALLLQDEARWTFAGTVAVVENAEAFWHHDRVLPDVDLAVFASGVISDRVLAWFASPHMAACSYVHWGDYDPMGTYQYRRLRLACPGRVQLHVPETLADLLPIYGKADLVEEQTAYLDALRDASDDPVIGAMVRLFDRFRRGLEQEVLLTPRRS